MEQELKQEIEQFFDFEKNDTLEEFKINFDLCFHDFENKEILYSMLIKLFKNEKQNMIKDKKTTPEQYLISHRINIRETNHILNFLKEQLALEKQIEKKKNKHLFSSKKQEKTTYIAPRKKYRKDKAKIVFSEETILLAKKINNNEKMDNLTKGQIVDLIKYYSIQKDKMIHLKNEFQNLNNSENLRKSYLEIKKINLILEQLIDYKKKLMEPEVKKEKERHLKTLVLPVSREQIKELDEFLNISTLDIIDDLVENKDKENDVADEIEEILAIYKIQLTMMKNRKKQLSVNRKKLVDKLGNDNEFVLECNMAIKNINVHMNILNNLLNYLKHYKKSNYKVSKHIGDAEFEDELKITSVQNEIKNLIIQGKEIKEFDLKDIIYSYGYYLKYEQIDDNTLNYAKQIMNSLIYEEVVDENIIDSIYYVWDAIKYRLANTPKEAENTRKQIKDIRIVFDYILKNYKEDKTTVTHDYLFHVVDYFLNNEEDFLYLKQLVVKMPKVVNTRHINNDTKESEHVIIYIVKKFITNYRKMLKNKNSYYISKDYLKNVYLLFRDCYQLYLTKEEKKEIDLLLSNFMKEVNINLTSSRRKEAVRQDLKDMYTDKMYFDRKGKYLEEIDDYRLEWQINSFITSINRELDEKRVDLTDECSIKLGGKHNAYSIEKRDATTILKIHVIDLYNLFIRHSELDKYLFNQTLIKQPIDSIIEHQLNMVKNGIYPTITYEICFDEKGNYKRKNGHVDQFKMYKSKIQVKECYSDYHLVYANGDVILKAFKNLYRVSLIKNHGNYSNDFNISDMDSYFENILNQGITEYFKFNHLPFIYSGTENYDEQKFVEILNNISHILSRLNNDDFNKVYNILNNNIDEFHYSMEPFNGNYQLPIKDPVNYPGIMIQRIIRELVLDNRHNEEEYDKALKNYERELKALVTHLNCYNEYFDKDVLKETKGKIAKVKKIIF